MSQQIAGALVVIVLLAIMVISAFAGWLATSERARAASVQAAIDIDRIGAQATYWRTRCEQLTDAALIRSGAIPGPVMQEQRSSGSKDPMTALFSGMGVNEIDSRQKGQVERAG